MINLYNDDCFNALKHIEDNSINLIVTDPPYNIGIAEWDKIDNYIEWCGTWLKECERVLKDNGSLYFFHNDMTQLSQIMEWLRVNTNFRYNSFIIWDKGDFRALSWKNPSDKNNLRCWFNTCEYCLVYTFQDQSGLERVMLDVNNFKTLRDYFEKVQTYIALNKKQIIEKIGQNADHCFRWNSSQWDIPTPETYKQLIDVFYINNMDGFREYESLRQEYESLRYVHNLDKNHNNIWKSCEPRNTGKNHPTQKPVDILERIIKCSSREGDTVLDMFMGSGSTGVACMNTGRKFIGIEKDKKYFDIAVERIEKAKEENNEYDQY